MSHWVWQQQAPWGYCLSFQCVYQDYTILRLLLICTRKGVELRLSRCILVPDEGGTLFIFMTLYYWMELGKFN